MHLFLVDSYVATTKGSREDFLSSTGLHEEPELLVPAAAPCAHPPPRGVQTNLGKSLLVLESPVLVEILSFIWWWSRLPAPSCRKDTVGPGETSRAYPLMVWTLSGAQLRDTEEFPPS